MSSEAANVGRRGGGLAWLLGGLVLVALLLAGEAVAEEVTVPVTLQVQLLGKVINYDRGFPARAGGKAVVLIVTEPGSIAAGRTAAQLRAAIGSLPMLGGVPHEAVGLDYRGADALAAVCRSRHAAVVYLAEGLGDQIPAIRSALTGIDVLSVAAVPDYVPAGVPLGFDLISGRPKILVNLPQARAQNVAFEPALLKLARVYE